MNDLLYAMKSFAALILFALFSAGFCENQKFSWWTHVENTIEKSGDNNDYVEFDQNVYENVEHEPITNLPPILPTMNTDNENNEEVMSDRFLQIHKIDLDERHKYLALGLVVDKVHANNTANEIAMQLSTHFNENQPEKWISFVIPKHSSFSDSNPLMKQLEKNIVGNFWFTYGEVKVILMKTDLMQRCSRDLDHVSMAHYLSRPDMGPYGGLMGLSNVLSKN